MLKIKDLGFSLKKDTEEE